jgi:hypothetical protein
MTCEQPTPAQRITAAQDLAAAICAAFGRTVPGVEADLADGSAERTLVEGSLDADLLVLGSVSPPAPVGTRSALLVLAGLEIGRPLPSRPDGMASYAVHGCGTAGERHGL